MATVKKSAAVKKTVPPVDAAPIAAAKTKPVVDSSKNLKIPAKKPLAPVKKAEIKAEIKADPGLATPVEKPVAKKAVKPAVPKSKSNATSTAAPTAAAHASAPAAAPVTPSPAPSVPSPGKAAAPVKTTLSKSGNWPFPVGSKP